MEVRRRRLNELARRWNIQIPVNGFRDKVSPRSPFTPWRNLIRRRRTVPLFRDPRSRRGDRGGGSKGAARFRGNRTGKSN